MHRRYYTKVTEKRQADFVKTQNIKREKHLQIVDVLKPIHVGFCQNSTQYTIGQNICGLIYRKISRSKNTSVKTLRYKNSLNPANLFGMHSNATRSNDFEKSLQS